MLLFALKPPDKPVDTDEMTVALHYYVVLGMQLTYPHQASSGERQQQNRRHFDFSADAVYQALQPISSITEKIPIPSKVS